MRREIVADLAKRISTLTPPAPPPAPVQQRPAASARPTPAAPQPPPADIGPHYEYIVEKGQTLSLIAEGFGTTVSKILAANPGLKPNLLRVGQKLIIPAEDVPQPPKKGGRGRK
ncbi:MAG: LysM peptidoglycan-binding domain-containing protein [Kiritimatiellae bacterium]|nr:LysM peptidoglycan-binding domain-containing protein [Kiritimatiellia bacterium]